MKKTFLLLAFVSIMFSIGLAQDFSFKYGKITDYELSMKVYEKDTAAQAVIIYDDGYMSYDYMNNEFRVNQNLRQKIKILKTEGLDRATITLPYYYKSNGNKESISSLEAYSYNLENGKVVKTKLERKYIFDEEINSSYHQMKFSIPNVKVGSVIEFKYNKSSNYIYDIPDWYIQTNIPVVLSTYEILVPEYFVFNIESKGYEAIKVDETAQNQQFNIGYGSNGANVVTCNSRNVKFTSRDVPALKNEPYVWCKSDFTSAINFEINGTKFPNSFYKPFSQSWENLEETIRDKTDFGTNLKIQNPFKSEIKALIDTVKDESTKIELVYNFVKKQIKWNNQYSFYGNKWKEAIKNKTGDNGQINMILISALKDVGINAYPVLLRRRSEGRLPLTYPSFDKLTTFVVAAATKEGKTYYMDGSAVFGGVNVLPSDLMVDRARVLNDKMDEKWVDLTKIAPNHSVYIVNSVLDKEGNLNGTLTTVYINQFAYQYKSMYYNAKDSAEFIEKIENAAHFKISDITIEGKDSMSNNLKEIINFTKENSSENDFQYINPMIISHLDNNPFTKSERKLPIEFDYPYVFHVTSLITIPDNYTVEELPKSVRITMPDNTGRCLYQVAFENNLIQLNYRFELNQTVFIQNDYEIIRNFYAQVANKNAEMIVLKKK